MEIRVLGAEEMSQALEMKSLIEEMKTAFLELSSGRAKMPLRTRINLPEQEAVFLAMPAALPEQKSWPSRWFRFSETIQISICL